MGNRIREEQSHLPLVSKAGSGKGPWQSRLSGVCPISMVQKERCTRNLNLLRSTCKTQQFSDGLLKNEYH